ncbi:hypothetical protein KC360_g190 [Hortaea werneckii]|nr:hypothetical protein KC360_g190 [Hortaea werneckii]
MYEIVLALLERIGRLLMNAVDCAYHKRASHSIQCSSVTLLLHRLTLAAQHNLFQILDQVIDNGHNGNRDRNVNSRRILERI